MFRGVMPWWRGGRNAWSDGRSSGNLFRDGSTANGGKYCGEAKKSGGKGERE